MTPDVVELIRAKRDGRSLAAGEIAQLIEAYTDDRVADEQMAALLMAIVFRGLDAAELTAWTGAMVDSGERLDLGGLRRPTVDKHSTGGVGDKVSLVLAPLVARCGAAVPQLSGRGLGHTGGTLDKLESVPGFRTALSPGEMLAVLDEVGCVICAAGTGLAPADRKLYALRDVTGTVESIPLIASSIMSKKIAEGTSALVLDVKVGSGAFMGDLEAARRLAETMVGIGPGYGVKTSAVITRMDVPLGRCAGNALEVAESVETLRGAGPADLVEVTVALAREMLEVSGLSGPGAPDPAEVLAAGQAASVWAAMVRAQGGDPGAALPEAPHRQGVVAEASGFLRRLDAYGVGLAAWRLGAGRARKEDPVSPVAGVVWAKRPGDAVCEGEPVLELHADDPGRFARARQALAGAIEIGPEPPDLPPVVVEVLRG